MYITSLAWRKIKHKPVRDIISLLLGGFYSISLSSAPPAGLPAESATEGVVEVVHVAQPNRFLRVDLISLVHFGLTRFIRIGGPIIAVEGGDAQGHIK